MDTSALNNTFLQACKNGDVGLVRSFLEEDKIDPQWNSSRCLELASGFGRGQVVELLLVDGRADPATESKLYNP